MAIDIPFKASIDLGEGGKSLKSLKQEFKDASKELDGLAINSEKYVATLKKMGAIKDDIGDLNDTIQAFKPGQKLRALGNTVIGATTPVSTYGIVAIFL